MSQITSSLPGPKDITRHELPNGIIVLVRENHTSPTVVLNAMLDTGSMFETRATAGLARITAAALTRGTETRSFEAIYETIESIGAGLSINSVVHRTAVSGRSLAEDLPTLLGVMADTLRAPTFPAKQIELLRGQIITELQVRRQDTRRQAALAFKELSYPPDHPYHRSVRGYLDTVPELTRAQIAAFHQKHYGPRGMIVVIVGATPAQAAIAQVEAALGDWDNPQQPDPPTLPTVAPPDQIVRRDVAIPDKTQSDIVLGVPGPARTAPDWWPAYLGNNILGVFGLYGRLGSAVRDELGLAYYSYSTIDSREGPGPWQAAAGVNPANVAKAIEKIVAEIARITTETVTETELNDSQSNIAGLLPLQLESNAGVAHALAVMERYQLGLDYLQRYVDIVRGITREEVLAAARHYLNPEAYAVAVAGPPASA